MAVAAVADRSGIEWTDATWNPTTGCDRLSPGCENCYALTLAKRLKGMGSPKYQADGDPRTSGPGFGITDHPDSLATPLAWRTPRKVFVNSMSDLFHKGVDSTFIARVWAVMAATPQHTYQVLTKRHGRMRSLLNSPDFYREVRRCLHRDHGLSDVDTFGTQRFPLPNVWLGVSVEDQKHASLRIPALLDTPAAVRWLSCEPLLGPLDLGLLTTREGAVEALLGNLDHVRWPDGSRTAMNNPRPLPGIDWVVAGGESGPGARPMHPDWARSLRDQCQAANVPFLFKQWGTWIGTTVRGAAWNGTEPHGWVNADTGAVVDWETARADVDGGYQGMWRIGKGKAGRELDGRTHDEYPSSWTAVAAGTCACETRRCCLCTATDTRPFTATGGTR